MRRGNNISVVFDEVPPGTHYRKGSWSWVNVDKADEYISKGYGREWKPGDSPYRETITPLPEDLPGRDHFISAGYDSLDIVRALEWKSVKGIGKKTAEKLEDYFG